ncbi:MAG: hypothetical protein MJ061_05960 [Mailhella sp.]|nr:hypothetical protein [Mailhella sp.]
MEWNALSLRLSLTGDIHCGSLPLGFVARTWPYVPCHLPVFAMVPAAVRLLGMPDRHASYAAVEALFSECVRCTPLYVEAEDGRTLFPWEDGSLRELEYRYLNSNYGVALDSASRSARDGHLFETEVILAHARGSRRPTCLTGALFFREGSSGGLSLDAAGTLRSAEAEAPLPALLNAMRLGGDRSRSLGRPARAEARPLEGRLWNSVEFSLSGEYPAFSLAAGSAGFMPVASAEGITGTGMVLTGRRHRGTGFGEEMENAVVAFAPGWRPAAPLTAELSSLRHASVRR